MFIRSLLLIACLIVPSWSQVDEAGTRFLLGDSCGRLALLVVNLEKPGLDILTLGEV